MARVGISEMRMRRKALAMLASIPMREKAASWGQFLWNWTVKFWGRGLAGTVENTADGILLKISLSSRYGLHRGNGLGSR